MQVRHLHKFSCEKSKSCRKIIEHCYRPEVCYKDITKRHLRSLCHVDLYVFGFPCQNFSNLGRGQGTLVENGQLIMYSLAYIEAHKPTAIIIENVSTIPTKHRELLDFIDTTLSSCGYTFQWKILNALDFGVPQSRSRWYGVAILQTAKRTGDESFFPEALEYQIPLSAIIQPLPEGMWQMLPTDEDTLEYANVVAAYRKHAACGVNPFESPIIIDVGSSPGFSTSRVDASPCLTRSRCGSFGYWCSTKGGLLDVREMALLQGFNESEVDWRGARVSEGQFAAAIGNGMCATVLQYLIPRVLYMAKLATSEEVAQMLSNI